MNDTEQWLSTGNCELCRRKKYCGKPCKPSQYRRARELTSMMAGAVFKALTSDGRKEQ